MSQDDDEKETIFLVFLRTTYRLPRFSSELFRKAFYTADKAQGYCDRMNNDNLREAYFYREEEIE